MEKNPNYYYRHEVEFENKKNKQFYKKKPSKLCCRSEKEAKSFPQNYSPSHR